MSIDFEAYSDTKEDDFASGINITPLIDVLLVLLVMIIITIPVNLHAVSIDLPGAVPPSDALPPAVVRIEISENQQVQWDGEVLADRAALEERLREVATFAPQPEIHIQSAARSKYDAVAAVLTSAQRMGLQKVGVVGLDAYASPAPASAAVSVIPSQP